MWAERYLNNYKKMLARVERYKERIEKVENVLKSINLDGMPKGTAIGDPTKNAAITLAELRDKYAQAEAEAELKCAEIIAMTEKMENEKFRTLIYSRYIDQKLWVDVAKDLDRLRPYKEYEPKSVMGYMKHQALREFERVNHE